MGTLTHERLSEVLDYDPRTGHFKWKVSTAHRVSIGDRAGATCGSYVSIRIDGTLYRAHRLAWFMINKVWPVGRIDHIDRNGMNNAIANLREVTAKQNAENSTWRRDNTSGYRGVVKRADCKRWVAQFGHNGKRIYIGIFKTPEEAAAAYKAATTQHFTHLPGDSK